MALQPFTPAGVAAKQAELNALSQEDLQTQAGLIKSSLQTWMKNNFSLTTAQQTFLASANAAWLQYTADVVSFAVANKLSVLLSTSGNPNSEGKLIHTTDTINAGSNGTFTGSVNILEAFPS